jgi:hypothetical protein
MTRKQRALVWLAMTCGGVTLYQGVGFTTGYIPNYGGIIGGQSGTGCARFASNGLATSVDFCYLLDCQNGFFGGIVDPCAGGTGSLLVDCSDQLTTTGANGTTTGNTTTGNTTTNNNTTRNGTGT